MREYVAAPATFTVPDDWSCAQAAYDRAEQTPDNVAFQRPVGGSWTDVTNSEFAETVRAVGRGLVARGVGSGDRVALLSSTRYEWNVVDFAIWAAGAVTVPVYDSSSAEQIRWIMEDSGTQLIIVENEAHAATAREAITALDAPVDILVIDGDSPALDSLAAAGEGVDDGALDERRASVTADSPATLIYTSGTTGRPKGCMLTHRNFMSETLAVLETPFNQYLRQDATTVMFLPLAHVLARAITYAGFHAGVRIAHSSDLSNLVDTFGEMKPHYILAVPRVFQKVFNKAQATAQDGGTVKAWMFDKATDTAVAYSKANRGGTVGPVLKLRHALFSKLVYSKLVAALGGQCEIAISGGAPLGERLTHFFDGIGVNIFEGYGLTETCAAIAVNTPGQMRIGSVGQPLPGCAVRIAPDGEVEVSGPVVTSGYWQNESATAESFSDGWFRTGDLGSLDEDGYLTITGRKKEIIVTAGGKNVAPSQLEDALRADPLIGEAVCVGDGKPFISVLLTLDPESLERWKNHHGKSGSVTDLLKDAALTEHLDHALARANRTVSHSEAIKKYHVLPDQFTEETGELTASLKVKRNVVHQKFAAQIADLYA
ncbi:long-chain fatty acid--CoA ligase [Rhodococcus sp. IEGM 1408]|uniref:AMP-dependent synthetase/ligase n=1 Tax=Rhodococcus sp. IEGM 1408 TaxID=3082220 RepID=UPI002955BAAE|nr:long-chain fatty acid--CoA ligase [Rhodococcus sp. IEGM 1408]MDV8001873.1 long-chain fatty acid--CoA ligase [Rhodococcus sp. IEGM 1408]